MQDIVLIGIQGSGKGTQGKFLAQRHGYVIFETGGALRSIAQEDSELGRKVKEIINRGDLVSNQVVMEIVENFLQNAPEGSPVVFDGIPRSQEQRESLEKLLEAHGRDFHVIEISVPEKVVMDRLLKRAELEGRADDNPESIKKRIENFHAYTSPIVEHWKAQGKVITVNGDQDIQAVDEEVHQKLQFS